MIKIVVKTEGTYFLQSCLHAELIWVAGIDARHEGVDDSLERLLAQMSRDPLSNCFLLLWTRSNQSDSS